VAHPTHRDAGLEMKLQGALDSGKSVWVIGDVHGYFDTASDLIKKINLKDGDFAVSLGDLVDRGPNSARTIRLFRAGKSLFFLLGNHEFMMLRALETNRNKSWNSWLKFGGVETLQSFGVERGSHEGLADEWVEYLKKIPTEIVLDKFRLVHAGFDSGRDLENQRDHERLWSREIFYSKSPIDEERQVIVGHTPVQQIEGNGEHVPWMSELKLRDGRSAIVGIDTGICLDVGSFPRLTAMNLQDGELIVTERLD
jgi:hypothetical protein